MQALDWFYPLEPGGAMRSGCTTEDFSDSVGQAQFEGEGWGHLASSLALGGPILMQVHIDIFGC